MLPALQLKMGKVQVSFRQKNTDRPILCNESEGLSRYDMRTNWLLSTAWIETRAVFL